MLVIREASGSRIVGMILSLLIGIPLTWAAAAVEIEWHETGLALFIAVFGVPLLLGGLWLLWQSLYSNYFYAAIDEHWFIRRTGPRRLLAIPMDEIGSFLVRRGSLRVEHLPTGRNLVVIKDAYAPERLNTLAQRLSAWRAAPPETRPRQMESIDRNEIQRARTRANGMI